MPDQTPPSPRPMKRRVLRIAAIAAFVAVWLFCPIPLRSIGSLEADHVSPASEVRELPFVHTRSWQAVTVHGVCRLTHGKVHIDVLDAKGHPLAGPFVLTGSQDEDWTFVGSGFPTGTYRLSCTPHDAAGRYSITVSKGQPITLLQRIIILWILPLPVLIILCVLWLVGIGRNVLRKPILALTLITSTLIFSLIYPVLHEAGHIAPLAISGAWDPSKTDLIGISGRPHIQGNERAAHLQPLVLAITYLGGAMLPTLVGYALFALWISPLGRRWREKRLWLDLHWSVWTALLVFPQAAATPFQIAAPDTDYLGFVKNDGLPLWLSISLLITIALINAAVVVVTMKHLFSRLWAARRARATPVPQELQPT